MQVLQTLLWQKAVGDGFGYEHQEQVMKVPRWLMAAYGVTMMF